MKSKLLIGILISVFICGCFNPFFSGKGEENPDDISVSITPASAYVTTGGTKQFSATVANSGNQNVTWSVSGDGLQGDTVISQGGLLTVSADEEIGAEITVTAVSAANSSKSGTAVVTVVSEDVYIIVIVFQDEVEGDTVTADPTEGIEGTEITLSYTVIDNDTIYNLLHFGGINEELDDVTEAEEGTRTYTINSADANDGVITIIATFTHTDLQIDPIEFTNNASIIHKTYGDTAFTNAIKTGHQGTGVITYSSEDETVATVSNSGVVTIHKAGTTVITAAKAADEVYAHASASYSLQVALKTLTITGVTAVNRAYIAGNTTVALTGGALQGVVQGDTVGFTLGNGTMANDNTGTNKPVTTAITLTGSDAGNYTLTQPVVTVNITDNTPSVMQMVEIEAGTLTWPPSVTITLSAFQMGIYEVTQDQYMDVMGVNPSHFSSEPADGETQGQRPVEMVSWYDAIEFCNKLSEKNDLNPVYEIAGRTPATGYPITAAEVTANWGNNGYRLPTEAQWEYAVRAGSTTNWYFGNTETDLENHAWYYANANSKTHQVGKKTANDWGLYDMYGNVNEMCWDLTTSPPPYPVTDQTDYKGPDSGDRRIMRGGGYSQQPAVGSGTKGITVPDTTNNNRGFRVVLPSSGHVHNFSGAWQKDAAHHWKVCAADNVKGQKAAHFDNNSDNKCDECGNDMPPGELLFTQIGLAYSVAMGTSTDTVIEIPAIYNGRPVTQIAADGFNASKYPKAANITNITIPDSVTSIQYNYSDTSNAFAGSGIWTGTPDNSVVYADKWAVGYKGTANGSLTLRDNTVGIGNYAFNGCSGFTGNLIIPDTVKYIGDFAFFLCEGFTGSLIIPNNVTSIGNCAFYSCLGFTGSLTIGNSVITIGNDAFSGCGYLTGDLIIPNSVTSIGYNAFVSCVGFTGSLTIGNNVTSIGNGAFWLCPFTGDLTIPKSVLQIGNPSNPAIGSVFFANKLTSFNVNAENTNFSSANGILYNKTGTILIQAPGQKSGSVTIPSTVTSIGVGAFGYLYNLTAVTILDSVTFIGEMAFMNTGLTSVTFQGTIASAKFESWNTFPGDLRDKFYAADSANGTPGTYTRDNEFDQTWEKFVYAIGGTGPAGGIIFYYSEAGFTVQGYGSPGDNGYFATYTAHYLEAAPENETSSPWGAQGTSIADVTTFTSVGQNNTLTIGVGRKDTQTIVNSTAFAALTDTAAQRCASKDFGGKTDWFLPSLGELNEMYKARVAGVTGIPTTGIFWSSSQLNTINAWLQNFGSGSQDGYPKNNVNDVRAIRAF